MLCGYGALSQPPSCSVVRAPGRAPPRRRRGSAPSEFAAGRPDASRSKPQKPNSDTRPDHVRVAAAFKKAAAAARYHMTDAVARDVSLSQLLRVQEETKLNRREAAYLITIFNDSVGKRKTMKRGTFCTIMTSA